MAIVTLSDYKTYSGITSTVFDTTLQAQIDSAEAEARQYCGRNLTNGFEAVSRTEIYESESNSIQLVEFPVASITSITMLESDNTLGDVIPSTDYTLDSRTGIVKLNASQNQRTFTPDSIMSSVRSNWGFVPTWGRVQVIYVSAAIQANLKRALYRMVDTYRSEVGRDDTIGSQSLGTWSVSFRSPQDSMSAVHGLLNGFRSGGVL